MGLGEAHIQDYNELAKLASQYEKAGTREKAAQYYGFAGQQAAAQYAYNQASSFLTHALKLTSKKHKDMRYTLLLTREGVYGIQGKRNHQLQDLNRLSWLVENLNENKNRAEVMLRQASYYEITGDYPTAITLAQAAQHFAATALSKSDEAASYLVWGKALLRQSDYEAAKTQLYNALDLAKTASSFLLQADSLRFLGVLSLETGDLTTAEQYYQQALQYYHQLNNRHGKSYILNNLGHIAYDRGSLSIAQSYWQQALAENRGIDDRAGQGMVLNNLSAACLDLGKYNQAQAYNKEMLTLCRQIGLQYGECMALISLGLTHYYLNENATAYTYSQNAIHLAQKLGCPRLQGYALTTLGKVLTGMAQLTEAREAFISSITFWKELSQPALAIESHAGLANVALLKSHIGRALVETEKILTYLASGNTLEGTESPFAIFWICYQVLMVNQKPEANDILSTSYKLLKARAAEIDDEGDRRSFYRAHLSTK